MVRSKTRPCWALALRYMLGGYVAVTCCKIGEGAVGGQDIYCFFLFFCFLFSDRRFAGSDVCPCKRCITTNSDNSCHVGLPIVSLCSLEL